jgi:hypothetical protein
MRHEHISGQGLDVSDRDRYMAHESPMNGSYVENRNGDYWIAGTRVSLDSIVYTYWVVLTVSASHVVC